MWCSMRHAFLGARLVGLRRGGPVVWCSGRGAAAMAMVFIIDGIWREMRNWLPCTRLWSAFNAVGS